MFRKIVRKRKLKKFDELLDFVLLEMENEVKCTIATFDNYIFLLLENDEKLYCIDKNFNKTEGTISKNILGRRGTIQKENGLFVFDFNEKDMKEIKVEDIAYHILSLEDDKQLIKEAKNYYFL